MVRCTNRSSLHEQFISVMKGWRNLYVTRHNEVVEKARSMVRCVEESLHTSQSVEIGLYEKILGELKSSELSFLDVKMLLFKPKYSAALHLVGLHYCFAFLEVPVEDMVKVVVDNEISKCQVCVRWSTLGRLLYGFRMRDESHSLIVSLHDVASSRGHGVLRLLARGAVHEVMRVQISPMNPTSCWCCQADTSLRHDHDDIHVPGRSESA